MSIPEVSSRTTYRELGNKYKSVEKIHPELSHARNKYIIQAVYLGVKPAAEVSKEDTTKCGLAVEKLGLSVEGDYVYSKKLVEKIIEKESVKFQELGVNSPVDLFKYVSSMNPYKDSREAYISKVYIEGIVLGFSARDAYLFSIENYEKAQNRLRMHDLKQKMTSVERLQGRVLHSIDKRLFYPWLERKIEKYQEVVLREGESLKEVASKLTALYKPNKLEKRLARLGYEWAIFSNGDQSERDIIVNSVETAFKESGLWPSALQELFSKI